MIGWGWVSLWTSYILWALGPYLGSKFIEQKTCLGGDLEEAMSESGEAQGEGHIFAWTND